MKSESERKSAELVKMEGMFKEYGQWRAKLELIEQKMKQEVDYWRNTTEKF